jgi:cardiolipin synthase
VAARAYRAGAHAVTRFGIGNTRAMVPEITPGPEMPAPHAIAGAPALLRLELNMPNLITLARLLSVPVMIWLIFAERYGVAFWVFVGAGVSDALDGYIAKRFDLRTRLGALLDPIADKALLAGVYVTLGLTGQLPGWLVGIVVLRDFLIVAGFVLINATAAPKQFGPLYISKVNTLVQIVLIGFVLARLGLGIAAGQTTWLLIAAAALTTVLSGVSYLARWARILTGSERAL